MRTLLAAQAVVTLLAARGADAGRDAGSDAPPSGEQDATGAGVEGDGGTMTVTGPDGSTVARLAG